jgi:hypothetical protein
MRNLKSLGVALVAVFALTAVMASAASAASYTTSSYPTTGTAESAVGNDVLTTEGGTVECKAHYAGTLTEESTDLTVTPKYTNCKAFGFIEALITGCKFTFTEPTSAAPNYTAKVDIVNPCTIIASNCHVTIPVQGPLSHVGITNNSGGDVSVRATVTGIKYNVIKDGFLCTYNGTGAKTGATFNQGAAVTFDSTNGAAISVS